MYDQDLAIELEEAFRRATADFPGGSLELPEGLTGRSVDVLFSSMASIAKGDDAIPFDGVGARLGGDFKVKQMYQLALNQWVADKHPDFAPREHIASCLKVQKEKVLKKVLQPDASPAPAPAPVAKAAGPKKSALNSINATALPPRPDDAAPAQAPKAAAPAAAPKAVAPAPEAPAQAAPAAAASEPVVPIQPEAQTAAPKAPPAAEVVVPAPPPPAPATKAPVPPPPPQFTADGIPIISNGIKRMQPPPPPQPSAEARRLAEAKRIMDSTGFAPEKSVQSAEKQLDEALVGINDAIAQAAKKAEESMAASAPNKFDASEAAKAPSERGMLAKAKFINDRASISDDGFIIENGGPEIGAAENRPETLEEKYIRLGFPPRPPLWPPVMAWPMHSDVQMLDQANLEGDDLKKMFDIIRSRATAFLARAEQINKYINENYDPNAFGGKPEQFRDPHLNNTKNDPFRGVYWASLLDPMVTQSTQNLVASWSHNEAKTMDGGYVRVSEDQIFLGRTRMGRMLKAPTEQAIELALREGQARGWPSFKCRGNPEFAAIVAKKAKELGIRAEIDVMVWPKKKIVIAETPPKAPTPTSMLTEKPKGGEPSAEAKGKDAVVETEKPEGQDPFEGPGSKKQPKSVADDPTQSAF